MIRIWILAVTFLLGFLSLVKGQYTKDASCKDPQFDKKVDSYLSYTVPVISVEKAYKDRTNILFLDAREIDEYTISHLPDSRHIGYDRFDIKYLKDIPKDKKIVVYCSIGYRSEKIANKLKKNGFTNVYNLYGSLFEWVNNDYDVVDKTGKKTKQVHTYNKKWSQWVKNTEIVKIW